VNVLLDATEKTALSSVILYASHTGNVDRLRQILSATLLPQDISFPSAMGGDTDFLSRLLNSHSNESADRRPRSVIDINVTDAHGHTALILAAKAGHVDIARLLLENGASVNQKDFDGITALMHALRNRHDRLSELLAIHVAWQSSTTFSVPGEFKAHLRVALRATSVLIDQLALRRQNEQLLARVERLQHDNSVLRRLYNYPTVDHAYAISACDNSI